MSTVDKLMALADKYAARSITGGAEGTTTYTVHAREALSAALVEALDMGEPVAWLNVKYGTLFKAGEVADTPRNDELIASGELVRLYAAKP